MKVRGTRECQDCGNRWSYYDTGSVECPSCGSMRSVGVDAERQLHTASPADLDLSAVRAVVDEHPLRHIAERAVETTQVYVREHGFVRGGELLPLDDTYLAARELRSVADAVGRARTIDETTERYFLALLQSADRADRPDPSAVPDEHRASRGLAAAEAVADYRSDLRAYLEEHPDPSVSRLLETLAEHVKRVRALEGDVPVAESERLVTVAREVGRYLREGDEAALTTAEDRLSHLG